MKKISILLCIVMLLGIFTGCANGEKEPDTSKDLSRTEPQEQPDEEFEIAAVVKITGIPFFNVFEEGVEKAGEDLGINSYVLGPTEADPAQQVKIIEDLINSKVDAIVVVPNDATALEAVLDRARDAGILVIANESPGQNGADYDVEMIDNQLFAEEIAEDFAQAMGGEGGYALFVGGLSVPLHNTWADFVNEYLAENYPEMHEVTDRIPCGEDSAEARTKTLELMSTYSDIKGVCGFGSQGPLGAAEAVKEKNIVGEFVVVGNIVPSEGATYLKEGAITQGYLWNPADSGYAAVYTAWSLLNGNDIKDEGFEVPGIGSPIISDTGVLSYHKPLVITEENADNLGF